MSVRLLHVQKVSGISGSEAHLLALVPRLRALGWDARMLVLHEGEDGARAFSAAMAAEDVPVEGLLLRRDADARAFLRLVGAVRRHRPTILHTHLLHADLYGQLAGAIARVPIRVSTKHGFNEFRQRRAIALADRAAAHLAHRHIAISAGLAEYLAATEGFSRDEFEIVHYGIEPGPEPQAVGPSASRILAVGRLIPIKGFDLLLRAFAQAREVVPELELEIAGDGPLRDELRRAAGPGVRFLGRVDPIRPVLERAAIVVVPSRGEGFGLVALEAMERSRPVIAATVGGLPELVVDGETGLLVPPDDVETLAGAIVQLSSDPDLARRLGHAARDRALGEFDEERCVASIDAIYRSALGS